MKDNENKKQIINIELYNQYIKKHCGESYRVQWEFDYPGGFIEVFNNGKRLFSTGTSHFKSDEDASKLVQLIKYKETR